MEGICYGSKSYERKHYFKIMTIGDVKMSDENLDDYDIPGIYFIIFIKQKV